MLTEKELLQWAIKGIKEEIYRLEETVNQGKKYLYQYENGGIPKTPKTTEEIKTIIAEKQAEIEKLDKIKFNLSWKIDVELKDNE